MSKYLANVSNVVTLGPPRVIIYGPPGAGKTTASVKSRNAIMSQTEDGLGLNQVDSFPVAKTAAEIRGQVADLINEKHKYEGGTWVLDSADGFETLIESEVCEQHGFSSMADFPFYRGNVHCATMWIDFLHSLDALRAAKKMQIILIAHSVRTTVEDPILGAYDRMEPNLHKKHVVPLVTKWADLIGYLNDERVRKTVKGSGGKEITTSMTTGERILHVEDKGAYLAKNRFSLPGEIQITMEDGWQTVENRIIESVSEIKQGEAA